MKDVKSPMLSKAFFTAPFYKIDGVGSNHYASNRIIELIMQAENKILLCAQHVHDLQSFDPNAKTIFSALERKKKENPDIIIKLLKQVGHASLSDKRRAALAESFFAYKLNAPMRMNRLVHDKFIIIDDTLACISSSNFTPTQFAWSEEWQMKFKVGEEEHRKVDAFPEVNAFMIFDGEKELISDYERHFNELWNMGEDIKINL